MTLDIIRCHQMSYKGLEKTGTEGKSECRSKSIAKPPDYADRREQKSLSYFGS